MKFLIVLCAVVATAIAKPGFAGNVLGGIGRAGVAHVQNDVDTVKQAYNLLADGSYNYNFETGNGIIRSENGIGGQYAKGAYEYTSPEGEHVVLQYTADENGYQPTGSHILAIPDYILRSLEYNKNHPYHEK